MYTVNQHFEETDQFGFHDTITLVFKIVGKERLPNVNIGFNLMNSYGSYVSTSIEPLEYNEDVSDFSFEYHIMLPPSTIAPNTYSFRFVIFTEAGHIYDLLENECQIKINDTGTKLSKYEGVDYGSVMLNFQWNKLKNHNNSV